MTTAAAGHRVLILFAHPALHRSRVNRALVRLVRERRDVTFHDLYGLYPDYDVDRVHEQELLLRHDLLVLQHPLYWYSTPALVKRWIDVVLEHSWAYGAGGEALRGKQHAQRDHRRRRRARVHVRRRERAHDPAARAARADRACAAWSICRPYVLHGTHALADDGSNVSPRVPGVVEALRDGRADLDAARASRYFNHDLATVLRS